MFKKILFSILAAMFVSLGLGSIAGCNTVEGVGRDISAGGNEIREEANEHRR
jgi:predicted small secreted protein